MGGTKPFLVSVVMLAGLTTACGQDAATAEADAQDAAVVGTMPGNVTALEMPVREESAATPAAAAEAAGAATTSAAAPVTAAATVKSLPLRRGFYVASDTPCSQASNATLHLRTREGINWSREICTFTKIEKVGATRYNVTQSCSSGGAAWGRPEEIEISTAAYEIPNETSYTSKSDSGWESSARYCAQSSLPDPWRDNDISDLIN